MKKNLAAVLGIILCLGLCACSDVKQEVYNAAVSGYETAKAGYEEVSSKYDALKSKVDKYSTVIEALEKEDYDGAIEAVNAMRPAPEVTEVEITPENLWDYFEIKEQKHEDTDASGKLFNLDLWHQLSLKEEYSLANRRDYPTDVSVGFEYDTISRSYSVPCTIDYDEFTCDGSVTMKGDSHQSELVHFPESTQLDYWAIRYPKDPKSMSEASIITVENFEIVNASGTLYLVNK